jgi:hypothetical protein
MSLNPQGEGKSLYDVLEGTVSSYFARLAGVLQRNESVNGQYQTTVSSCYGGNTPVAIPNFTRVCFSTNGATVVDLANTYITMELEYKLKLKAGLAKGENGTDVAGNRCIFVGFKNSLEALSRYDIYVNSNKLYSQSWVGQESFIYNAGIAQTMRERNPYVYTSYKNASRMSPDVCGTYISFDSANAIDAGTEITVTIPVKINLHQILLLSSVRYLPSFCGRWEIELYPNWSNLVILPCPSPARLAGPQVSTSFVQIGKPFKMLNKLAETTFTATNVEQTITCNEGKLTQCLMNTTTFQLRFEVYEGLRQMYSEQPLIIPANILTYGRFSGQPNADDKVFHATLSQSLENCDSLFILVPFDNLQTTCFYQPYLTEVRLSLGEFGTRPQRYVKTWDVPRFLSMVLDSLK